MIDIAVNICYVVFALLHFINYINNITAKTVTIYWVITWDDSAAIQTEKPVNKGSTPQSIVSVVTGMLVIVVIAW